MEEFLLVMVAHRPFGTLQRVPQVNWARDRFDCEAGFLGRMDLTFGTSAKFDR